MSAKPIDIYECGSEIVLPPMLASAMAERLVANEGKSRWTDLTSRQCLSRAEIELRELRKAVENGEPVERITAEAGDVANFLAMLIVNYRNAKKEHRGGKEA